MKPLTNAWSRIEARKKHLFIQYNPCGSNSQGAANSITQEAGSVWLWCSFFLAQSSQLQTSSHYSQLWPSASAKVAIMLTKQLKRITFGLRVYPVFVLPILLLAACSSQQIMTRSQVALLHSGKLIINIPHNAFRVQSQTPAGELFAEAMLLDALAGTLAGMAVIGNDIHYRPSTKSPLLKKYAPEIANFPLSQDFQVLGSEVVKTVPWVRHDSDLEITHQPNGIGVKQMRHMIQTDHVNAIAFAQPVITFTLDMSALVMRTSIMVYVKGEHGPVFLDGGALTASTSLQKSGEPLTPDQMDNVDEGRGFINRVRAFRAKLWFANKGERFNIALAEDLRLTKQRLTTFLKGRHHA